MSESRAHPFDIVFGEIAPERFPPIRDALGEDTGLDAFLLAHPAIELLRDLRPDEGLGAAIDDFVVFVHAAFRFWLTGQRTIALDGATTRALCAGPNRPEEVARERRSAHSTAMYIQVAPRVIWAQPTDDGPYEPLDGWFEIPERDHRRVVGCLGVHPERPGLSVITVTLPAPPVVERDDGSPLFAPTMQGGEAAGLHALAGRDELALLAERAGDLREER